MFGVQRLRALPSSSSSSMIIAPLMTSDRVVKDHSFPSIGAIGAAAGVE